jgi:hypothetical protein
VIAGAERREKKRDSIVKSSEIPNGARLIGFSLAETLR